jgi:hypothetical protein
MVAVVEGTQPPTLRKILVVVTEDFRVEARGEHCL